MRREWTVGPYRDERGDCYPLNPAEIDREMVALGVMVERLGATAVVAPFRIKGKDGYTTVGLGIRLETGNVPAVDPDEEPALPEDLLEDAPESVAEPAASPEVPEPALAE